jgi:hypothetical protein
MTDALDDPLTELEEFEGSLLDPRVMEKLAAAWMKGLWHWHDDWQAVLYRERELRWKS